MGEGTRVWQQAQSVSGGSPSTTTTTDTVYALGSDETTTTSATGQPATTTNVRTYPLPGGALAERDATGRYYLATDQLGTPIATLRLDDGALAATDARWRWSRRWGTAVADGGR